MIIYHHCFSTLLQNIPLGKAQENRVGLKLNGTHRLLDSADVNLLGDNTDTIKKNTETLTDTSKEVGVYKKIQRKLSTSICCCLGTGMQCKIII
jgi:hypothetical protein